MSPPLEAAGVGGSIGRGAADPYSDVDFFLLYPSQNFFTNLKQFPELITHQVAVLLFTGPTFVLGFGFEYSYILHNGIAVDYILNCPDTINLNPMRAHTSILFDSTGFLTQITERARSQISANPSDSSREALHDYLSRLLKLRKSASRRDLPVIYYNLDKLRLVMLGIERALTTGAPYNSFHADHGLGHEMGSEYEQGVLNTFPSSSPESLNSAFQEICKRIRQGLRLLDATCLSWKEALTLERRLKSEVLFLIREIQ